MVHIPTKLFACPVHMRWERSYHSQFPSIFRVEEFERTGVKVQLRWMCAIAPDSAANAGILPTSRIVFFIANYRVPDFGQMRPQLMGSSGVRFQSDHGRPFCSGAHNRKFGNGRFCRRNVRSRIIPDTNHFPGTSEVRFQERKSDSASRLPGHSFDNRPIQFAHVAHPKLRCERLRRTNVARQNQNSGSILVKPVHEQRTGIVSKSKRRGHSVNMSFLAAPALGGKARRLVYRDQVIIQMKNSRTKPFGFGLGYIRNPRIAAFGGSVRCQSDRNSYFLPSLDPY